MTSTVYTHVAPAAASAVLAISGGTTQITTGTARLIDSNGISFGINGQSITGTVATTYLASNASTNYVQATAAFAGTSASGTIASNGISVSIGPYLTTAMASNRGSDFVQATAAFAGTSASGTIASNGISVSIGPYLTTAMASNRGSDFVAASAAFAGTSASGTIASNGISVSIGPYLTTAMASNAATISNIKLSAGTSSANLSAVTFSNSNGISFGLNGSTMTGSHNALTTAMASNRGSDFVAATAAFAGTSASGTIASDGISVSIGPYITTAMLSNAATISNIRVSAGTTSNLLSALTFADSNGVSFGINASTVTASIDAAPKTLSYFANMDNGLANTQTMSAAQSTSIFAPFVLPNYVSASYLRVPVSFNASEPSGWGGNANTTYTCSILSTINANIYSLGVGASSRSLQHVASGSAGVTQKNSVTVNAGSAWTITYRMTYPIEGTNDSVFTTSQNGAGFNVNPSSSRLTVLTGLKFLDIPFANSLAPGAYWLGLGVSSTTSTQSTAGMTQLRVSFSHIAVSQPNIAMALMAQATNSSVALQPGIGSYTTNAIGTTASVALANISSSASHNMIPFQLIRQA